MYLQSWREAKALQSSICPGSLQTDNKLYPYSQCYTHGLPLLHCDIWVATSRAIAGSTSRVKVVAERRQSFEVRCPNPLALA